jgi:hypothetical protein
MRALKSSVGALRSAPGASVIPQAAAMAQMNQMMYARTAGQLPRDPRTFLTGGFAPLEPIEPVGIDEPDEDGGLPSPRRWQYPVGWNMPIGVPGSEGVGKLTSFANLRLLADSYSILRAGIQVRKEEVLGLEWDIMPTTEASKAMRGNPDAMAEFAKRRAEAVSFFQRPDPNFPSFRAWLSAVLEEIFVTDALSLHMQPPRTAGKGVLGSNVGALVLIDGSTIRPLLNIKGGVPQAPAPAYQQYLWGVPRTDLTTVISGTDLKEIKGRKVQKFTTNQLLYLPQNPRVWTPYGFPPVERCIVPAMIGLMKQKWQMDYFEEGSIPGVFISPKDPNITPSQIREMQDGINATAGDPAWKHKALVVPGDVTPMRDVQLADQFDEVIAVQVLMALDVMPMELGISPKVSTTQSPGAANQMAKASEDVNQRKALKPMLIRFKESLFDYFLQKVCGQADMQWVWEGLETGDDQESQIQNLINLLSVGAISIDELREEVQRAPWGLPITSEPVIISQAQGTIVPLGSIDTTTGRPKGLPLPGQAAPGAPGGQSSGGGSPQGSGAKPPAGQQAKPSGTPAHAAAAAGDQQAQRETGKPEPTPKGGSASQKAAQLAELDMVRRRLRKGRTLDGWEPRDLDPQVWALLTAALDAGTGPDEAVTKARAAVDGVAHRGRRDRATDVVSEQVESSLGTLANRLRNGVIDAGQFTDQARQVLREGLLAGLEAGARHAADDLGSQDAVDEERLGAEADRLADEQAPFLDELARDILAASVSKGLLDWMPRLAQRLASYADAVTGAYERSYGEAAAALGATSYTWHAEEGACALCADRDGKTYTLDTLPGWPGTGKFGADLCRGGPRCRCSLTASVDRDDDVEKRRGGNARALIDWYEHGEGAEQIRWGEPGDFDRCVALAGKHIDDPEGFCNLRHQAATGGPPGHGPGEERK